MVNTDYYKRLRRNSFILNPKGSFGPEMKFLDTNNRKDVDVQIIMLNGTEKNPGKYYNADERAWVLAVIPSLEKDLVDLTETFKEYQQIRVDEGFQKPENMPDDMAEKVARIKAQLAVANEEHEHLRKVRETAPVPAEERETVRPRREWGGGKMLNGEVVERGGFKVSKDENGVPRIKDDRSPYDGMEHWRFIEQIVNPMAWEFSRREKAESDASIKENRPRKRIAYPEAGIWHKESGVIEYPDYSSETLASLKR